MAQLFHYTFATNLSEFSATSASNATIEQSAGAGLNGTTGGVLCTRTGTPPVAWGRVDHTLSGLDYFREAYFLDLSGLSILVNLDDVDIHNHRTNAEGLAVFGHRIRIISGVLNFRFRIVRDDTTILEEDIPLTNMPAWVETAITRETNATSDDGAIRLYFGGGDYEDTGQLVYELTDYANFNTFNASTRSRYGMVFADNGVTGTIKIDEIIARTDNEPILFGVAAASGRPYDLDQLLDLTTIRM